MNERIKEIARECKIDVDMHPGGFPNEQALVVQDFAEAIIRECISVIEEAREDARQNNTWLGDDVPSTRHQINIMRHFGVEE